MKIIFKKISDLRGYENNARLHSEHQIQEICNYIKNFGFNDPIELAKDNMILSGHGRLAAAMKLKMDEVPTITHDHLTETQKKAYILAGLHKRTCQKRGRIRAGCRSRPRPIHTSRLLPENTF